MLGTSSLIGSSGDGGGGSAAHESGGGAGGGGGEGGAIRPSPDTSIMASGIGDEEKTQSGGGGADLFESDRSTGGNRWPRQETIALLEIRSSMDAIFRDSSLKGPLWEEVSRKMAELGYHRSAKKCKEKFENVYKYHKRTKDGRTGKADGKTYRFFEQLEALEQHHLSMAASSALPPLPVTSQQQQQQQQRGQSQGAAQAAVPVTMVIPAGTNPASVTVPSSPHPISVVHTTCITPLPHQQQMNVNVSPTNQASRLQSPHHPQPPPPQPQPQQQPQPQVMQQQSHQQHQQPMGIPGTHGSIQMENPSSPSATQSSSSSTSSDEELMGRRKRKRKWKDFFEKLMKEVIDKQEELQKRFLEAVDKREHDRAAREEAWKLQEMARLNREQDILAQERSMAAAKDAALISFLQKLSDQQKIPLSLPVQSQTTQPQTQPQGGQVRATVPVVSVSPVTQPQPPPQPQPQPQTTQVLQQTQSQPQPQPPPQPQVHVPENPVSLASPTQPQPQTQTLAHQLTQQQTPPPHLQQALVVANTNNGDNGDFQKSSNGDNLLQASSSRWPKAEVQALINLRTNLDQKYQENGPKGPLWEEISAAMRKLGYNRNAKRCKEKWENINKYFKKVKESNKKRPEDSKTCPYFHQLDALYRERNKMEINPTTTTTNATPLTTYGQTQQQASTTMAPIMAQPEQQWPLQGHQDQAMEDQGSDNQDDSEDDMDDEDDDDQGSGGYEIVANNNNNNAGSMATSTTATRTAATAE